MNKALLVLLLAAAPAAAEVLQEIPLASSVDTVALHQALKGAGFEVAIRAEKDGTHTLLMHQDDAKDPAPYIKAATPVMDKGALALLEKWEAGKATDEEKDDLLRYVVGKLLRGE